MAAAEGAVGPYAPHSATSLAWSPYGSMALHTKVLCSPHYPYCAYTLCTAVLTGPLLAPIRTMYTSSQAHLAVHLLELDAAGEQYRCDLQLAALTLLAAHYLHSALCCLLLAASAGLQWLPAALQSVLTTYAAAPLLQHAPVQLSPTSIAQPSAAPLLAVLLLEGAAAVALASPPSAAPLLHTAPLVLALPPVASALPASAELLPAAPLLPLLCALHLLLVALPMPAALQLELLLLHAADATSQLSSHALPSMLTSCLPTAPAFAEMLSLQLPVH